MAEHIVKKRVSIVVYLSLLVLTFLTLRLSYVDLGRFGAAAALAIAGGKALLVLLFFMHAWYSSRMSKLAIGAGGFWLGILFVLTFTDYLSR